MKEIKDGMLSDETREKWEKVYHIMHQISEFDPWHQFRESDHFVFIDTKHDTVIHYSFLSESMERFAIACYFNDTAYYRAAEYLFTKNRKCEPVPYLQNAIIGLWGNRSDLSKRSYEVVKQLDKRGHGDGTWLHFEKYEEGFSPVVPDDEELDSLGDALGNLFMMVRAIHISGQNFFPSGKGFVRWFEPKDDQYYNAFLMLKRKKIIPRYQIRLQESDRLLEVRKMPKKQFTLLMDWSYLPFVNRENNKEFYPMLLLAVSQDGIVMDTKVFSPMDSRCEIFLGLFDHVINHYGKPREIRVCDKDLWCFVEPICLATGIKPTLTERLSIVDRTRRCLLEQF